MQDFYHQQNLMSSGRVSWLELGRLFLGRWHVSAPMPGGILPSNRRGHLRGSHEADVGEACLSIPSFWNCA